MKLLLDECVTHYLIPDFAAHEVFTVEEAGLKGLKNGKLLRAAAGNFDVLITVDKSIPHQQNIASLSIAVLIFRAKTNTYPDLKPLVPQALAVLDQIQPGEIVIVRPSVT
jgi:hypothetical protein